MRESSPPRSSVLINRETVLLCSPNSRLNSLTPRSGFSRLNDLRMAIARSTDCTVELDCFAKLVTFLIGASCNSYGPRGSIVVSHYATVLQDTRQLYPFLSWLSNASLHAFPPAALGQVRRDRQSGPPQLFSQRELNPLRQAVRQFKHRIGRVYRPLPRLKAFKLEHLCPPSNSHYGVRSDD